MGCKILVVQPVDPEGKPKGKSFLAVDGAQAGVGDRVLVLDEGGSARSIIGDEKAVTIRAVVGGDRGPGGLSGSRPGSGAVSERDIVRRVALGADHSSFQQKQALGRYLEVLGYRVVDVGCHSPEKVDYPDIAIAVCRRW